MEDTTRNENGSNGGKSLIDMAVRQSSAELKRIARYYKQIGRSDEASKIRETLDRMERKAELSHEKGN